MTYKDGFVAGLERAVAVVNEVNDRKWEEAGRDIEGFLRLELEDARAHADTGGCIASLLNPRFPRCPFGEPAEGGVT